MKRSILIADSGGSKTDWCLINSDEQHYFTTESFHPNQWGDVFFERFQKFWDEKNLYDTAVYFYGAGCLNEKNQSKMKEMFHFWGFNNVFIESDILGAGIAHFNHQEGIVCLLGTGSVAAKIENLKLKEVRGGLGYILGDEGSGVNFGKLLLNKLLNKELSESLSVELFAILGSKSEIINKVYSEKGKQFLASISKLTSKINSDEIKMIHKMNFELFIDKSLIQFDRDFEIGIIGSYGYFNREILTECLNNNGFFKINYIQYPIQKLTEYFINHTV